MLPNLIIIGAQKCATTSLHYYLGQHPEISMSTDKELDFFIEEYNWGRGLEWYESWFRTDARIRGEASPNYTNYPIIQGVAERMHATVPEARLIYLVRDPLDRIVSHYKHAISARNEHLPLSAVLEELEDNRYVIRSEYHRQIQEFLRFYPLEHIHVVSQERLLKHREETLKTVFSFLGVDPTFRSRAFSNVLHQTSMKRKHGPVARLLKQVSNTNLARRFPMRLRQNMGRALYRPFSQAIPTISLTEDQRVRLLDHLSDDIQRFRDLTGERFPEWRL